MRTADDYYDNGGKEIVATLTGSAARAITKRNGVYRGVPLS